jgi:hypothetical protein
MKDNKLIAEFMGVKSYEASGYTNFVYSEDNHRTEVDLAYHDSWDWLMPVVEKIECTKTDDEDNSDSFFNVMIEVFECNINGRDICICENGNTKLEATYRAVVEFIKDINKRLTDET